MPYTQNSILNPPSQREIIHQNFGPLHASLVRLVPQHYAITHAANCQANRRYLHSARSSLHLGVKNPPGWNFLHFISPCRGAFPARPRASISNLLREQSVEAQSPKEPLSMQIHCCARQKLFLLGRAPPPPSSSCVNCRRPPRLRADDWKIECLGWCSTAT